MKKEFNLTMPDELQSVALLLMVFFYLRVSEINIRFLFVSRSINYVLGICEKNVSRITTIRVREEIFVLET